jgi:hypothetical protein
MVFIGTQCIEENSVTCRWIKMNEEQGFGGAADAVERGR